ncbi:hypothetical protein, partial [Rhodoflexus sp.]
MFNTSSEPFFKGKSTVISVLLDIGCIFCVTKGFQPSSVYREQAEKQLEALARFRAHGIIWDLREAEVIGKEDQDWTVNEWQPRAAALGYRRGAIIVPENIFGQLSVKQVISQINNQSGGGDIAI